ncbi:hypothetical protein A0H76_624 [Hepatospora eriocheir]|uniref:Uncharacterized protein n=1 Tax=Hepatospora eriocheir TaxID=1081669 RepID=A0A1X0Q6U4_9MICR|nr:hypothetical protein A0H76_778 [Hepatospora eriocheir]ORD95784.1 hypothetical protein A0H76_624 [Hepatospora eriocheir]
MTRKRELVDKTNNPKSYSPKKNKVIEEIDNCEVIESDDLIVLDLIDDSYEIEYQDESTTSILKREMKIEDFF